MDKTLDYLEQRRQDAVSEMQDILNELEKLKELYKIEPKHFERITELVIDKGLETIQNYENAQSLGDNFKVQQSKK